ncbi:MAG: hypothetical protein ACYC96_16420 [Fimbriimonadaceae bacterium]
MKYATVPRTRNVVRAAGQTSMNWALEHPPLAEPHGVPDHLTGTEMEIEALYGYPARFSSVLRLADSELLGKH